MTKAPEKSALKKAGQALVFMLVFMLLGGSTGLQAQTLAVPEDMPSLYKEIPAYILARPQARYPVRLPGCAIESREDGYYITRGDQEFVILNQNPACLKRFVGKTVEVQGKTTESMVPWCRLYCVVIAAIDGKCYTGKVGPWMRRAPTDAEICFFRLHRQLPPATRRFIDYLALPKPASECRVAGAATGCATLASDAGTSGPATSLPGADVSRQLTAIQSQLTVIEQRLTKKPYQGIKSIPSSQWNTTDWTLYADSQGAGQGRLCPCGAKA